jgi:hypothetical protein
MPDFLMDFEWYRPEKGFRLVLWSSMTRSTEVPRGGHCLLANQGSRWITYRPLDEFGSLYVAFANVKTPVDLLRFANNFGPLTRVGFTTGWRGAESVSEDGVWADDVSGALRKARLFRELLLRRQEPRALASYFNAELRASQRRADKEASERAEKAGKKTTVPVDPTWERVSLVKYKIICDAVYGARIILKSPPPGVLEPTNYSLNIPIGDVDVIADGTTGIRVRFNTDCLITALLWQLARTLSGNTRYRECRHCGDLFELGPGAKRRADATFCCNEHSVRFHSAKRTIGA